MRIFSLLLLSLLLTAPMAFAKKDAPVGKAAPLLADIYEPSAVVALPDGPLLVLEDEADSPFFLLKVKNSQEVKLKPLDQKEAAGKLHKILLPLNDLEGAALDGAGQIYVITSHALSENKEEKPNRKKLARLRFDGEKIREAQVFGGLKEALSSQYPFLDAVKNRVGEEGGLNIEGLAASPDGRLLVGLRSPLKEGKAVVIPIEAVDKLFAGHGARFGQELLLELNGQGVRDLHYDKEQRGYWIISGPVGDEKADFGLWFWPETPGAKPARVTANGFNDLRRPEAVQALRVEGKEYLLLLSDEGKKDKNRPALYLLLPKEALSR